MKAVIDAGGRQCEVEPQQVVVVGKLSVSEGESVEWDKVLMVCTDDDTLIGAPYVEGAKVVGRVLAHEKGRKIKVFKYKPKKRYRRTQGHRQWKTKVLVEDIMVAGG